jgi:hypothetical protein
MQTSPICALVALLLASSAQATTDLGTMPRPETVMATAAPAIQDWQDNWSTQLWQRVPGLVITSNVMAWQLARNEPGILPSSNIGSFPGNSGGPLAGVPEPAAWALLIIGFGLVGSVARGRRPVMAV